MLSRRLLACAAVLTALPAAAQPTDPDSAPAAFIESAGRELGSLVAAQIDPVPRRDRIAAFLDRVVDMERLGRFCLGRYWTAATSEQQSEYRRLFRLVLANNVASRLASATANVAQVKTLRPERRGEEIEVPTIVQRPNNRPNRIVWVVVPAADGYRIVDVTAEGISLRLTQRSDYTAFISRNSGDISLFLRALQQQADSF